jgi:hypothetical protein
MPPDLRPMFAAEPDLAALKNNPRFHSIVGLQG